MGRARQFLYGFRLFIRSLQAEPVSRIPHTVQDTLGGRIMEVYEPPRPAWKTVIPAYGMGLRAERDPRLFKFIQACLEAGTRVVVPNLAGVRKYEFQASDLEAMLDAIETAASRFPGRISIVAFSAGASISLSAAADPRVAGNVHSLLLFGPLYDIREGWHAIHSHAVDESSPKMLDASLWTQYVIAYRNRDRLGLSETEKVTIHDILWNYDFGATDQAKKEFFDQVIAPRDLPHHPSLLREEDVFDLLSPRGKLENVQARVAILHDSTDMIVPPGHARRIMDELERRPNRQQRLLVSPLLTHVTVEAGANLRDVYNMIDMLGEVFV
jgi:pimeloyl-ACP methyl ester carboxylesterase